MIIKIDKSFEKDVRKIKDKKLREKIALCVEELQDKSDLSQMRSVKRLKGDDIYFRIRIQDYRLGLMCENDVVTIIRFLHRKDNYQYFPKK